MDLSRYQRLRRLALAALVTLAFLLLLVVRSSQSEEAHGLIEALGLGLIVVGIVGRMWCTLYIGGRKSAEIVEAGPYSVTRNPLYVFSAVAAGGVGAQTGSLLLAFAFALGCALAFQPVIRREERFLAGHFGALYEAYRRRVPRFVPRLTGYSDRPELTVRTDRVYRTLLDGLVFFAAMPVLEIVELMQDHGLFPTLLVLP